ncbi:MAG: PEP-CTERM sorting domain-containing protein, partial [Verrucomicrobia bacterium]|nr:PEP-CTERM sorting domain-containing protein [Verrucomicrobiota bacterium]
LRLTGGTPFGKALDANNVVNLYFADYGTYQGGFFTDLDSDFSALIANATFNFYLETLGGSVSFEGNAYNPFSPLALSLSSFSVVQVASANFADGTVTNGWTMEFVAIPEPGTLLLVGMALASLLVFRRRK